MDEPLHPSPPAVAYPSVVRDSASHRLLLWLAHHWLLVAGVLWGLYVGLPWLAPVFMQLGATGAGQAIYTFYSTQCHQLPERSYFLFGPKIMYSLSEVQAAFLPTNDPLVLRQFVGNSAMGWKVAWSDRMVSLYGGIFVGMLLFGLLRKRLQPLRVWLFVLSAVPMALDGGTHFVSDLVGRGVGAGFRDSNAWLAMLTGNLLPATFYAGDALGSFNWWMRLLTGLLFGLAVVFLAFPYLENSMLELISDARKAAQARPVGR